MTPSKEPPDAVCRHWFVVDLAQVVALTDGVKPRKGQRAAKQWSTSLILLARGQREGP